MQRRLIIKLGMIGGLVLLLLIPLQMVREVVHERQAYRAQARLSVQNSWTGQQKVIGPLLVVPYEEVVERKVWDKKLEEYRMSKQRESRTLLVSPTRLEVTGDVATEERKRGLYSVPVYTSSLQMNGRFDNQPVLDVVSSSRNEIVWKKPILTVLISDLRGIISQPAINWSGSELEFQSGTGIQGESNGMHVPLAAMNVSTLTEYSFDLSLMARGMERIEFAPLGKDTRVTLNSTWPHPSFIGRYLPADYQVDDDGFTAHWLASSFSSNMNAALGECTLGKCDRLLNNTFGVSLITAVDIYLQAERSIKYGVLFLSLTFTLFFLYEVMKQLAVHPVQYLLVGLALSIFFLLLVSLSELLPFGLAYTLAAAACSLLLASYVSGVLHSLRSGVMFAILLSSLYVALYMIIRSEDNALLMGSLLLFLVLSVVMLVTRRMDWYAVGDRLATQWPNRRVEDV